MKVSRNCFSFKYYLFRFDFTKHVASVRLGRAFKKYLIVYKENRNQLKLICIEEPFSRNSGRSVYDSDGYNEVVKTLKRCTTNCCLKGL